MYASQALFVIGNLTILRSEKLPFIFLHHILLSVFMGRRTPAFEPVPPPVGGFWMGGGITYPCTETFGHRLTKRNTSFRIF